MSVMSVLGKSGDTEIRWDPDSGEGLQTAKRTFDEKTARHGYLAFVEGPNGDGVTMIRSFDPKAKSIILAPRLVGG